MVHLSNVISDVLSFTVSRLIQVHFDPHLEALPKTAWRSSSLLHVASTGNENKSRRRRLTFIKYRVYKVNIFCVCGKYRHRSCWNYRDKHSVCLNILSFSESYLLFSFYSSQSESDAVMLVLWLFHRNGHFTLNGRSVGIVNRRPAHIHIQLHILLS